LKKPELAFLIAVFRQKFEEYRMFNRNAFSGACRVCANLMVFSLSLISACRSVSTPAAPPVVVASPPVVTAIQPALGTVRKIGENGEGDSNPIGLIALPVVQAALCPAANNCRIEETFDAGKAPNGNMLTVVGIRSTLIKPKDPSADDATLLSCPDEPLWLLETDSAGKVLRQEFIMTAFEDNEECSYGVAGGDESISFVAGKLKYDIYGGSNWKWSTQKTFQLTPKVRELAEVEDGFWSGGMETNTMQSKKDDINQVTRVSWNSPICGEEDLMVEGSSDGEGGDYAYGYDEIPLLSATDSFVQNWQSAASVPQKMLTVGTNGKIGFQEGGYVIHGNAAAPSDPKFWVSLAGEQTVYVEVTDANPIDHSASWVSDDHLEIWASEQRLPSYMDFCLAIDTDKLTAEQRKDLQAKDGYVQLPLQWGVRVSDGKVFAGFGNPKQMPKIERVAVSGDKTKTRFKIDMPFKPGSFAVVYSDSDQGKKQKRLTATSVLRFGNGATLGPWTAAQP
jgi:hypothetical protein